jgi:hypothetical protein
MPKTKRLRARAGVGLIELLIALIVMAIIGIAMLKVFISQTRFSDQESKLSAARAVSRAPLNLLMSEARMVEIGGGVVAASATSGASSITLRVPLAMGLVCGTAGGATVLSMMPTDSLVLADAALSGYAYRAASGYAYTETPITLTAGAAGTCAAASITTIAGGRVVSVTPALPLSVIAGTPAFFYQRVKYGFAPSVALSGRLGFWRTLEATNVAEELAAPFDTSSRIRFYENNNATSTLTVPALSAIRGLELVLTGTSANPRFGRTTPESATIRTAVFFINRIN